MGLANEHCRGVMHACFVLRRNNITLIYSTHTHTHTHTHTKKRVRGSHIEYVSESMGSDHIGGRRRGVLLDPRRLSLDSPRATAGPTDGVPWSLSWRCRAPWYRSNGWGAPRVTPGNCINTMAQLLPKHVQIL